MLVSFSFTHVFMLGAARCTAGSCSQASWHCRVVLRSPDTDCSACGCSWSSSIHPIKIDYKHTYQCTVYMLQVSHSKQAVCYVILAAYTLDPDIDIILKRVLNKFRWCEGRNNQEFIVCALYLAVLCSNVDSQTSYLAVLPYSHQFHTVGLPRM